MIPLKSDVRVDTVHLSLPPLHSPSMPSPQTSPTRAVQQESHLMLGLRALLMVPLFPLLGYWLLDQTGVSQSLVAAGVIPQPILGEGFGHVGLCMSIHYLIQGGQSLARAIMGYFR